MYSQIKQSLLQACTEHINQRIATIRSQLDLIEESRNNETKSSAGDKYETGRAMMQMEEDKAHGQLQEAMTVKHTLQAIDPAKIYEKVETGSLVGASNGMYFISVGVGKVSVDDNVYYCISIESPIGLLLKDRKVGDQVSFRGHEIKIHSVV